MSLYCWLRPTGVVLQRVIQLAFICGVNYDDVLSKTEEILGSEFFRKLFQELLLLEVLSLLWKVQSMRCLAKEIVPHIAPSKNNIIQIRYSIMTTCHFCTLAFVQMTESEIKHANLLALEVLIGEFLLPFSHRIFFIVSYELHFCWLLIHIFCTEFSLSSHLIPPLTIPLSTLNHISYLCSYDTETPKSSQAV